MLFDPAFFGTTAFLTTLAAAIAAALVRGFSGFGAAMTFIPIASAAYGPTVAAPTILLVDFVLTLPFSLRATRNCRWPTVLPAALAAMAMSPLGARALATGDPTIVRWTMSIVILLLLGLIVSGWRYRSEPKLPISIGVGGAAGLLSGFAQMGGPPVIAFWISGPHQPATIRANLFVFFALITVSSFTAYFLNGMFKMEVLRLVIAIAPAYGLSLYLGSRLFGRLAGTGYRPLAYAVIAIAAISSTPALDGLWR